MKKEDIILVICLGVIIVAIVAIIYFIIIKKRKVKIKIDDDFINSLITSLGGKSNITSISVDNARLKFELNDLKLANLDGIKALSENGVFVTGKSVKTLFRFDSKTIKEAIDNKL